MRVRAIEPMDAFCARWCSTSGPGVKGLITCVKEICSTRFGGSAFAAHLVNQCWRRTGGAACGTRATGVLRICCTHVLQQRGGLLELRAACSRSSMKPRRSSSDQPPPRSSEEALFFFFGFACSRRGGGFGHDRASPSPSPSP